MAPNISYRSDNRYLKIGMIKALPRRLFGVLNPNTVKLCAEKLNKIRSLGFEVKPLDYSNLTGAAKLLSFAFAQGEPISGYLKAKPESYLEENNKLLESLCGQGPSNVVLSKNGEVVFISIFQDGQLLFKKASSEAPPLKMKDPGLRYLEYLRRFDAKIILDYCQANKLTDQKHIYYRAVAAKPEVAGTGVGLLSSEWGIRRADELGYTRFTGMASSTFSGKFAPDSSLIFKMAFSDIEIDDYYDGKIKPFSGINEWYNKKINADRIKKGKPLLLDKAKYLLLYESDLKSLYEHNAKMILSSLP